MVLVFIACEGECTFPDDDLDVVLHRLPVPHGASVNAHGDRPIWDGEVAPIPGAALDETPVFLAQFRFTALGHLQGIMRTVLTSSVTSSGRKSVRASTVMPYDTRDDHFVSIKSSSGATDSVSRDDRGRNDVVLRRLHLQW